VIRHPLWRAYVAFHEQIVSGKLADHRRILMRDYRAKLPEPGEAFANAKTERAAFLVFLHYAQLSVSGQSGQRVDPHWASQTAIIQGFAGFHPLDLVIREDRLPEALGFLEARLASGSWRHLRIGASAGRPGRDLRYEVEAGGGGGLCPRLRGLWLWPLAP
jgi:hypothetical protein